jgi:hypothetical protein
MNDYNDRDNRFPRTLGEPKERCAVSDTCEGICRERHLNEDGLRCPAWFTDEMDKRKHRRMR